MPCAKYARAHRCIDRGIARTAWKKRNQRKWANQRKSTHYINNLWSFPFSLVIALNCSPNIQLRLRCNAKSSHEFRIFSIEIHSRFQVKLNEPNLHFCWIHEYTKIAIKISQAVWLVVETSFIIRHSNFKATFPHLTTNIYVHLLVVNFKALRIWNQHKIKENSAYMNLQGTSTFWICVDLIGGNEACS